MGALEQLRCGRPLDPIFFTNSRYFWALGTCRSYYLLNMDSRLLKPVRPDVDQGPQWTGSEWPRPGVRCQ